MPILTSRGEANPDPHHVQSTLSGPHSLSPVAIHGPADLRRPVYSPSLNSKRLSDIAGDTIICRCVLSGRAPRLIILPLLTQSTEYCGVSFICLSVLIDWFDRSSVVMDGLDCVSLIVVWLDWLPAIADRLWLLSVIVDRPDWM